MNLESGENKCETELYNKSLTVPQSGSVLFECEAIVIGTCTLRVRFIVR
jgi:hypothetical protein